MSSDNIAHRVRACGAVYDFGQNEPGWCELRITGQAGLNVQLRHAELLQHPPYGPEDGSICESHHVCHYVSHRRRIELKSSFCR